MVYVGKRKLLKLSKFLYLQEFVKKNRVTVFFDTLDGDLGPVKSFFVAKGVLCSLVRSNASGVALLSNLRGGRTFIYVCKNVFYPPEIKFPLIQFLDGLPCLDLLETSSLNDVLQAVSLIASPVNSLIRDFLLLVSGITDLNLCKVK